MREADDVKYKFLYEFNNIYNRIVNRNYAWIGHLPIYKYFLMKGKTND